MNMRYSQYYVQGINAQQKALPLVNNKPYPTLETAIRGASKQACNASNVAAGNEFIVFKTVARIKPTTKPYEVIKLRDSV